MNRETDTTDNITFPQLWWRPLQQDHGTDHVADHVTVWQVETVYSDGDAPLVSLSNNQADTISCHKRVRFSTVSVKYKRAK